MGRIVYVVARNQPLLRGYLMAKVGTRTPDGDRVEVKLDERRAERRLLQRDLLQPERRRRERRRQPSLDAELQTRGYARVFQSELRTGSAAPRTEGPAVGWRRRSTRLERGVRTWRRRGRWTSDVLQAVWRKLGPAMGLGLVVAVGSVALWLARESELSAAALFRSLLWGVVALLVWTVAWSWWRRQDLSRSRRRRRE
jgi:hypothetical protein